jgi:anti-sigma regulatory factor (Ser/Thr protein kinase)
VRVPARRDRPGAPAGGGAPVTDRWRLAWLNEASSAIGTTLDLKQTSQELAAFCVPEFADAAAVDLLESVLSGEDGMRENLTERPRMRAMAVAQVDGLVLEPDPVGEPVEHPNVALSTKLLTTRRPVLTHITCDEDYGWAAPTASAGRAMREAGVHSLLAVPLIARGVLLGTADFLRAGNPEPFTEDDVAMALELASKAAVFIDNARLYERERDNVVALQRAMLPRRTPGTPGLQVESRYLPSADPAGVGGDWFDVVALPGGRTALVVGDVMGHGLAAAATMGRLRTVARTLMSLDIAPDRVLARLDLAARDLEEDQVATCLCVVYDPADGTCTMTSAGHLPPLLIGSDGSAEHLAVPPGAPLGAGVIPYEVTVRKVPEGARVLLYTDGLVKNRRDDIDVQMERLRDAVKELPSSGFGGIVPGPVGPGPESSARGATGAGVAADARFDDAVVLAVTHSQEAPDIKVWDLGRDGRAAGEARRLVRAQLDHWGLAEMTDTTELVVSELVGNALRYAAGPGQLRLLWHERLVVEISDTGPDLPEIEHSTLDDEGGRGLQLINMLCRRWGSCRTSTGKVVWAEQDVPGFATP